MFLLAKFTCGKTTKSFSTGYISHTITPSYLFHTVLQRSLERSYNLVIRNPADLLSRGISTQQLFSSELWLHGPSWLLFKQAWPQRIPTNVLLQLVKEHTDCENKTQKIDGNVTVIHNIVKWFIDCNRTELFQASLAVSPPAIQLSLHIYKRNRVHALI